MRKKAISLIMVTLVLGVPLGCSFFTKETYELANWRDGFGIEIPHSKGSYIVIPDVRALQTTNRFVSGSAFWRYTDGFYAKSDGSLMTNEFWFVLDKHKHYPKCYAIITTNKESWMAWCNSNNVPTNVVNLSDFLAAPRTDGRNEGARQL